MVTRVSAMFLFGFLLLLPGTTNAHHDPSGPTTSATAIACADITSDGGSAYRVSGSFVGTPDSQADHRVSTLVVFEDGVALGPAHSVHAEIRTSGAGRFSHWSNGQGGVSLYFSSSDGADPRNCSRTYSYALLDEDAGPRPTPDAPPTRPGSDPDRFDTLKIFPGAEGFGTDSPGGRGGELCFVTNLDNAGPGSFRDCVQTRSQPRIVLFRTGGRINLDTPVRILHPFISIYGQSAPGDGIVLNLDPSVDGAPLQVQSHDVLVQHLRFRPETPVLGTNFCCRDALNVGNPSAPVYNVVVDHNSFSWGVDEIVDTWYSVRDVTFSFNNISEGLRDAGSNAQGPAGRGALLGEAEAFNISFHHNLMAHNQQRNPRVGIGGHADVVNNVTYNWTQRGGQHDGRFGGTSNWVKNLYIAHRGNTDPDRNTSSFWADLQVSNASPASLYLEDNIGYRRPDNSLPQWQITGGDNAQAIPPSSGIYATTRFAAPTITEFDIESLEGELLDRVGATEPKLDDVDRRILANVRNRTGGTINCVSESDRGGEARCADNAGGYPTYDPGVPYPDADNDGVPDSWESSRGTDPALFDSDLDPDGNGYSNLEEWIHGLPMPEGGAADISGANGPVEVSHTVTCLAGNGRVDTNIVNTGANNANYRIEFDGLSARAKDVATGDWWRMPITGRPDRNYQVVIKRNSTVVSSTDVTVACDGDVRVSDREVQVVNACRAGTGYLLFQFANPTAATKSWVIEFEGVPNRSTSAAPHGGSVRAVTGRPNGTYEVRIRTGSTIVASFQAAVSCG